MNLNFVKTQAESNLNLDSNLILQLINSTGRENMQSLYILKSDIGEPNYDIYYEPYSNIELSGKFIVDDPNLIATLKSTIGI